MKLTAWMRRLDQQVLGRPRGYTPKSDRDRLAYLQQQAAAGLPMLGYAEVLRPVVVELLREVTALRAEVEALKRER